MLFDRNIQQFKNVADGPLARGEEPSSGPAEEMEEQFAPEDEDVPF